MQPDEQMQQEAERHAQRLGESKPRLFTFKREVSLDTIIIALVAIVPIACVVVSDHFTLKSTVENQNKDHITIEQEAKNQVSMMVTLERVSTRLDSINWPHRPPPQQN